MNVSSFSLLLLPPSLQFLIPHIQVNMLLLFTCKTVAAVSLGAAGKAFTRKYVIWFLNLLSITFLHVKLPRDKLHVPTTKQYWSGERVVATLYLWMQCLNMGLDVILTG